MQTQIEVFEYGGKNVEFDLSNVAIMINATAMGKVFGTDTEAFMRNQGTKEFIKACLKTENSRFLSITKEEELYTSRQRAGTWMHRVLALKFAAWLDPDFEVWVYVTIEAILFADIRERLQRKAGVDAQIARLRNDLVKANQVTYDEIAKLEAQSRSLASQNTRAMQKQYRSFRADLNEDANQ